MSQPDRKTVVSTVKFDADGSAAPVDIPLTGTNLEGLIYAACPVSSLAWNDALDYLRLPENPTGWSILDIGAGASNIVPHALALGADAYAVDAGYGPNLQLLLKKAHQHADSVKIEHLATSKATITEFQQALGAHPDRFIRNFATKLQFPDNRFKLAISTRLHLGHLDDNPDLLIAATQENLRVVEPGGRLALSPLGEIAGWTAHPRRIESQAALLEWLKSDPRYTTEMETFRVRGEIVWTRLDIQKLAA